MYSFLLHASCFNYQEETPDSKKLQIFKKAIYSKAMSYMYKYNYILNVRDSCFLFNSGLVFAINSPSLREVSTLVNPLCKIDNL